MTTTTAGGRSGVVLELTGESTSIRTFLRDLARGVGLIPMLAGREFRARYRSSSLGLVWSVILPLVQAIVLAVVINKIFKIKSAEIPYPIFILLGTTVWGYFIGSFQAGSSAIVGGSALAGRLYFPRMILPAIPALSNLPSFSLSMVIVLIGLPVYGMPYRLNLLALPLAVMLVAMLAIVMSAVVAMLHVYVRDVSYVVSAATQIWFYGTPVIYPFDLAKAKGLSGIYGPLIAINPVTGIVQLFRWCVFGKTLGPLSQPLMYTGIWIAVVGALAVVVYARYERVACDRL